MTGQGKWPARRRRGAAGLVLAGALVLGGCGTVYDVATHPVTMTAAGISVASVVVTDKTVPDHVVSLVTGQDCSTVRYADGGYYCVKPLPDNAPIETRLYCYRSLAGISCYDQAVPGEQGRLVTDPRHVISSRAAAGPVPSSRPGQR